MKQLVAFVCVLLMAAPVAAQTGTMQGSGAALTSPKGDEPEGPQTAGVNEDGERRICRRLESTGSRNASRRLCLTAREWREYNRN